MRVLEHLSPDETRILPALSDGSSYALLDVVQRSLVRQPDRVLLANASEVGRRAGVAFPDRVPGYVSRLIALGVAERGPANGTDDANHEILETDPAVRAARAAATGPGRPGPTTVRQTLRLTPYGAALWRAATR